MLKHDNGVLDGCCANCNPVLHFASTCEPLGTRKVYPNGEGGRLLI
jgi:hypothetical protein